MSTAAPRAAFLLSVDTDACDEKRLATRNFLSVSSFLTRNRMLSLSTTDCCQLRPAMAASGARSTFASGSSASSKLPPPSA